MQRRAASGAGERRGARRYAVIISTMHPLTHRFSHHGVPSALPTSCPLPRPHHTPTLSTPHPTPQAVKIPLEPRHVAEYAAWDDAPPKGPLGRALQWLAGGGRPPSIEDDNGGGRRGPRLAPSAEEVVMAMDPADRDKVGVRG